MTARCFRCGPCHGGGRRRRIPPPPPPENLVAVPDIGQNTLTWTPPAGPPPTSFNLYWSLLPGVTKATGTQIAGVTSPFLHAPLVNGQTYYYVVTAVGPGGESAESNEANGTPGLPPNIFDGADYFIDSRNLNDLYNVGLVPNTVIGTVANLGTDPEDFTQISNPIKPFYFQNWANLNAGVFDALHFSDLATWGPFKKITTSTTGLQFQPRQVVTFVYKARIQASGAFYGGSMDADQIPIFGTNVSGGQTLNYNTFGGFLIGQSTQTGIWHVVTFIHNADGSGESWVDGALAFTVPPGTLGVTITNFLQGLAIGGARFTGGQIMDLVHCSAFSNSAVSPVAIYNQLTAWYGAFPIFDDPPLPPP